MTVRVAIMGTGWGTRIQVPGFRQAGLDVTALWGRSAEKAAKSAAELGIPFSSADPLAVIGRDDVDLVSIVTPPDTHAGWSIAALAAGKHVLCEKPTALNRAEADAMWQAAQAHPQQVAVIDHELRFLPTRARMRTLIAEGYVGKVTHMDGVMLAGSRLDANRAWNWWSSAEQGGGVLGAIGSHYTDMLRWLSGREVQAVSGELRTVISQRPGPDGVPRAVTSDDWAAGVLDFGDGIRATLLLSVVTAGRGVSVLRVAGTKGTLVCKNEKLTGHRAGQSEGEDLSVAEDFTPPAGMDGAEWLRGTVYIGQALKQAIETGDHRALAPAATFADGLKIQQVLDAWRESAQARAWVTVG